MQRHEERKAKTTKDTKVARRLFQRILRVALMSFVILIWYDALEMRLIAKPVGVDEELGTALLVT